MARGAKPGQRKGGRAKGTQNKRTIELKSLTDRLFHAGVTPLEMLLVTARDLWEDANKGVTPDLKKRMKACAVAEKALPYLHPKLSNVTAEVTGANGGSLIPMLNVTIAKD